MAAPWAAVPLPAGKPAPSGPMLKSHVARSASVTFWPSPGVSAANAAPALNPNANSVAETRLRVDMLGLPLAVDPPAGDGIHVSHREGGTGGRVLGLPRSAKDLGGGGRTIAGPAH